MLLKMSSCNLKMKYQIFRNSNSHNIDSLKCGKRNQQFFFTQPQLNCESSTAPQKLKEEPRSAKNEYNNPEPKSLSDFKKMEENITNYLDSHEIFIVAPLKSSKTQKTLILDTPRNSIFKNSSIFIKRSKTQQDLLLTH